MCGSYLCCSFTVQFKGAGSTALKVLAALYSNSQGFFQEEKRDGFEGLRK